MVINIRSARERERDRYYERANSRDGQFRGDRNAMALAKVSGV